jgi:Ca-activated chloride channel homolog
VKRLLKTRVVYLTITCILFLSLLLTAGCATITGGGGKTDDWKTTTQEMTDGKSAITVPAATFAPSMRSSSAGMPAPTVTVPRSSSQFSASGSQSSNIGLATGGAKDIQNFRENILNNYLPLPTDVTYEGLFYDYYFDTGNAESSDKLFYPSYSYAVTRDPLSREVEYYLSVGLNSGMKESDFARKKLNLVVVLDVSGSMGSPFDTYYYDRFGNMVTLPEKEANKTKIEVARESVVALLDHLNDGDSFGMVLFDTEASLAKPLNPVAETDMDAIKDHILQITAGGSTNLDAGMQMATGLFDDIAESDAAKVENRIIILTDAQPNTGDTSRTGFMETTEANSLNHLYTTFIGIGVDFNTDLIESITKIRGSNYYSVHSSSEFKTRMDDEFEYMVTPLVFNLLLTFDAAGWDIEEVYGSPEADQATGQLMKVNTLFPSKVEDGQTRGGLVLLKLKKTGTNNRLSLKVSYEDRRGNTDGSSVNIIIDNRDAEYFENSGIRKGVLLARYADLLKNWMIDERGHVSFSRPWEPCINEDTGIIVPRRVALGEWERQSLPLMVSPPYQELFSSFLSYFTREKGNIGDDSLSQETKILETLVHL